MKNTARIHFVLALAVLLVLVIGYVFWLSEVKSAKQEADALALAIEEKTGEHRSTECEKYVPCVQ